MPPHADTRSEIESLRVTCRSQARVIDALGEAVSGLRRGAAALKAENADLRAEHERLRSGQRAAAGPTSGLDGPATVAVRLPCDVHAPAAARGAVARCLRERVATRVLDNALLVVSELVTNSVRHSGACAGEIVVVRASLGPATVALEVEDAGRGGVVAPRSPDVESGGGFGLPLVQALSERWGLERVTRGGTRVWALLPRAPVTTPADSAHEPGTRSSPAPADAR